MYAKSIMIVKKWLFSNTQRPLELMFGEDFCVVWLVGLVPPSPSLSVFVGVGSAFQCVSADGVMIQYRDVNC